MDVDDLVARGGVVIAGAGTGKTTATVRMHRHAHARGVRVIVITFTNAAVSDYVQRCNEGSDGGVAESCVTVFTFHKLAAAILSPTGDGEQAGDASVDTVVALAVEQVRASGAPDHFSDVGAVLVDESQDASRENYELVTALARATRATVVMVGDPNQNLYRFRNASTEYLLDHAAACGGVRRCLDTNWRSTPQIVALCAPFMRHPTDIKAGPSTESGPVPRVHSLTPSRALDKIVALCAGSPDGSTVAVIGRSKRPRFVHGNVVRMGLQTVVNELERRRVPYKRFFRECASDDGASDTRPFVQPGVVNVMTIHGSKGLEADRVIVIDALQDVLDGDEAPDNMELMYVALSRARRELHVVNSCFGRCDPRLKACAAQGLCVLEGFEHARSSDIRRKSDNRLTVTGILQDRSLIGETDLLHLSRLFEVEPVVVARPTKDFEDQLAALPEVADLGPLYGHLAENVVQMAYHEARAAAGAEGAGAARTDVVARLDAFACARVSVPQDLVGALKALYRGTNARVSDTISRSDARRLLKKLRADASAGPFEAATRLLEYVLSKMDALGRERVSLVFPSHTQKIPANRLRSLVQKYDSATTTAARVRALFDACMFFHQLSTHSGYRWGRDYSKHVSAFMPFARRIHAMAKHLPRTCTFEQDVFFKPLALSGRCDAFSAGRVVEFKFTSRLGLAHFVQPCVYAMLSEGAYQRRTEVWNLASGERVRVDHAGDAEARWAIFRCVSRWTGRPLIADDVEVAPASSVGAAEDGGGPSGEVKVSSRCLRAHALVASEADVAEEIAHIRASSAA